MKVRSVQDTIASYEEQIDEWSAELKESAPEIEEMVQLRQRLPIEKWSSKHFERLRRHHAKYNVQKQEITKKLQYSCYKK